jgi:hypothetical protein
VSDPPPISAEELVAVGRCTLTLFRATSGSHAPLRLVVDDRRTVLSSLRGLSKGAACAYRQHSHHKCRCRKNRNDAPKRTTSRLCAPPDGLQLTATYLSY